jgi:response regulator of citrate/malate metabolism
MTESQLVHDVGKMGRFEAIKGPRVLVVEDDVTSESLWDQIVHRAFGEADVAWTTNVSEAALMIKKAVREGRPFDLVISDVFLSGSRTGIDLWIEFHDELVGKFLLVSSVDNLQIVKYLRDQGSPPYLQKPVDVAAAVSAVFNILTR